jgi:hypothetical protein
MPDGQSPATLEVVRAIPEIAAADWDACAGTDNPFVGHAFLSALEESGSATADEGWMPHHLALKDGDGRLIGCAPMYVKGHSYGEYVFDHGWAHAFERAGGDYYPKLQGAVPFTPATGPRLLVRPGPTADAARDALIGGMETVCKRTDLSSVHVTFPTEAEWRRFGDRGWLQRTGQQYHWHNRGYATFDDFLADLASRKRKAIKKERRAALESGVRLHTLTGDDLKPEHWDAFYRFYRATTDRKWGEAYLKRPFFDLIGARLADRIALVMAEQDGEWVAGALNLIGDEALYGRNWGAIGRFKFLHFEACYYRAIDFAIERGLSRVEAGAQGQHKIQRGYLPERTFSAHYIRHPGLRAAVADFLDREGEAVDMEIDILTDHGPFRKGG